jgi:hypothetical protein
MIQELLLICCIDSLTGKSISISRAREVRVQIQEQQCLLPNVRATKSDLAWKDARRKYGGRQLVVNAINSNKRSHVFTCRTSSLRMRLPR